MQSALRTSKVTANFFLHNSLPATLLFEIKPLGIKSLEGNSAGLFVIENTGLLKVW